MVKNLQLASPVINNTANAYVMQISKELNALNAMFQLTMVPSAKKSVDAINLDQLASPVINKANANVKEDSKELNALNAVFPLTMVPSAKSVDAINLDQ